MRGLVVAQKQLITELKLLEEHLTQLEAEIRRVSVVTPGSKTFFSKSQAVAKSKSTLGRSVPIQMRA